MEKKFLTVSKAAKITGISEKRLRYYDQHGLFSPAHRDAETGYRYYTRDQLQQLQYISYLRSLNLPVSLIADFLRAKDVKAVLELKAALDQQVVQAQKAAQQAQYQYNQLSELRQNIGAGLARIRAHRATPDVSLLNTEMFPVVEYNETMPFSDLTTDMRGQLFGRLAEMLEKYSFVFVGGYCFLFRNHPRLAGKPPASPTLIRVHAQIRNPPSVPLDFIRTTGGILTATATHVGSYETLPETYQAISRWAKQQGYALSTNSMEECFLTGQTVANPDLYVTQVFIPLAGQNF